MKQYGVIFGWFLRLVLAAMAMNTHALTLGPLRGNAVLGQALAVTVPVTFSADEDLLAPCFSAEVLYGDALLDGSRVSLTFEITAAERAGVVRLASAVKVDEPVVAINLKAGCTQKTARRYVVFADLPPEVLVSSATQPARAAAGLPTKAGEAATVSAAPFAGTAPQVARPVEAAVAKPVQAAKPATERKAVDKPAPERAAVDKPTQEATRVPERASAELPGLARPADKSAAVARPRLKLSLADGLGSTELVLKSADLLLLAPKEDMQKRQEAAALWQALNATPEQILRDTAQRKSLDGELKELRERTVAEQRSLQAANAALAEAQAQRYDNPLVYGLSALLAAVLAVVGYVGLRLRRAAPASGPWWRPLVATQPLPAAAELPPEDVAHVDLPLAEDDVQAQPPPAVAVAQLHVLNTDEMLDAHQQAEFFAALGQHQEAVAVLESGIAESPEPNPRLHLDLLGLLHTQGKRSEFDSHRLAFQRAFSGLVPAFDAFPGDGRSVEDYPEMLGELVALWPSAQAMTFLEQCMQRRSGDGDAQGLDMPAFRDLLFLQSVLRILLAQAAGPVPPVIATPAPVPVAGAAIAAVAAATVVAPALLAQPQPAPGIDLDLGLDIDLGLDLGIAPDDGVPQEQSPAVDFDFDLPELITDQGSPDGKV